MVVPTAIRLRRLVLELELVLDFDHVGWCVGSYCGSFEDVDVVLLQTFCDGDGNSHTSF